MKNIRLISYLLFAFAAFDFLSSMYGIEIWTMVFNIPLPLILANYSFAFELLIAYSLYEASKSTKSKRKVINNYYGKKHKLTYIRYLDITNHK